MTNQIISLQQIELFWLDLPQKRVFQSGIGIRKSKETLIVKWIDREGRIGYGECACRPDPYFSSEFLKGAWHILQDFIVPQLSQQLTYQDLLQVLQKHRGWNFTRAAVEVAAFGILRQQTEQNLLDQALKADAIEKVPVGISLGFYPTKEALYEAVVNAIAEGYQRIKFKIAPQVDISHFEHINPLLVEQGVYVSFDANGSYYEQHLDQLQYFVDTYGAVIEQPTPPSRFDILLQAKARFPKLKVCFDEEITSIGDLVKLHQLHIVDEVNLKIGRVGGIASSIAILNYCHEHQLPCWLGGMFETGIGRLLNLEMASYLPDAKAHDLSPSSRYFKEDIIAPAVQMEQGFITVAPSLESQVVEAQLDKFSTQKVILKP
ncbi:MAG: o-succinylbenzoate synthase [Bacteroidota bacterium]